MSTVPPSSPPFVTHPNAPRRGTVLAYFFAVVGAGLLGGAIGWGLVEASCSDAPLLGERLLAGAFDGYSPPGRSCDLVLLGGALLGTVVTGLGAGVLALLMMRAQSEWRSHPPGRP